MPPVLLLSPPHQTSPANTSTEFFSIKTRSVREGLEWLQLTLHKSASLPQAFPGASCFSTHAVISGEDLHPGNLKPELRLGRTAKRVFWQMHQLYPAFWPAATRDPQSSKFCHQFLCVFQKSAAGSWLFFTPFTPQV